MLSLAGRGKSDNQDRPSDVGTSSLDTSPGESCFTCAFSVATGYWPPELAAEGGTHCRDCHRDWTSKVEAHCAVCHCHFSTNAAADLHDAYCTPVAGETRKRLLSARRASGNPILALRDRKHGPVFVSWSPQTTHPRGAVL